jgi:2'-5' RNA ligase
MLEKWRRTLEEQGILVSPPKMGNHITLIPPFWHMEDAAQLLAWGFDMWDSVILAGMGGVYESRGREFDFFRNKDEDAFVIRIDMPPLFERAVERGRAKIPKMAKWKYPPESYEFNPHVTIGVGKDISGPIQQLLQSEALGQSSWFSVNTTQVPRVLRKSEASGRWEPVA